MCFEGAEEELVQCKSQHMTGAMTCDPGNVLKLKRILLVRVAGSLEEDAIYATIVPSMVHVFFHSLACFCGGLYLAQIQHGI